jgi:hypothetical protein
MAWEKLIGGFYFSFLSLDLGDLSTVHHGNCVDLTGQANRDKNGNTINKKRSSHINPIRFDHD